MLVTRQQAQLLLSAAEMELYDESRSNPLRKLDAAALENRIARMRRARERARDLLQRQKLASRNATGSKRGASGMANQRSKDKAALLDDILKRFEAALDPTRKATAKPAAAAPEPRGGPASAATRRSTARPKKARVIARTAPRQATGDADAAAETPARKLSARDTAARKRIQASKARNRSQGKRPARDAASRSRAADPDAPSFAGRSSRSSPGGASRGRSAPTRGGVDTGRKRSPARRDPVDDWD